MSKKFEDWITELDEDVIQGDFGYEPGEFTVYPEHWRRQFNEGLTPTEAFRRAMDAHKAAADERCQVQRENWERIQAEDAATLARIQST